MTRLMMEVVRDGKHYGWALFCPACGNIHVFNAGCWAFNGDHDKPSFTPSMKVTWPSPDPADPSRDKQNVCHSFVTEGEWRYCGDSTHSLAGKNVPVPGVDPETGYPPREGEGN